MISSVCFCLSLLIIQISCFLSWMPWPSVYDSCSPVTSNLYVLLFLYWPRLYLTPVRDEEAESQRKAKSRHARQTRRSTQVKNEWISAEVSLICVWLLTDIKLYECPAGCDSDRPERGSEDQQPVLSRQADGGGRHAEWQVLSEERLNRWEESQDGPDRIHRNHRDQS